MTSAAPLPHADFEPPGHAGRCVGCGYSLQGLSAAERCPECGWSIAASRGVRHQPAWLRRVAVGLALDAVSTLVGLLFSLSYLINWPVRWWPNLLNVRGGSLTWTLVYIGGYIVHLLGVWAVSTRSAVDLAEGKARAAAWTLRGVATAAAALGVANVLLVTADQRIWTVTRLTYVLLRIAVAVAWWGYVGRLARRVGRADLAGVCTFFLWLEPMMLILGELAPWIVWLTVGSWRFWPRPIGWLYVLASVASIGFDLTLRGVLRRDAAAGAARLVGIADAHTP